MKLWTHLCIKLMEEFIKIVLVGERYLGEVFFYQNWVSQGEIFGREGFFSKIGLVRERYLGEFFLSKLG